MRVLVIVPAYNEEQALEPCIEALLREQPDVDVLIVNDGSGDGTERVAAELANACPGVRYVNLPINGGIGTAVQTGIIHAYRNGYDCAIQYDGDGQHEPTSIADLIRAARESQLDLCVGSRFLDDNDESFRSTPLRRVGIRFFSGLISLLCGVRVTDPTSGFRLYGRRALRLLSAYYPDDYPEPEAVFFCAHNGLSVGETSVRMYARVTGITSIRYLRVAYYMVKVTIAILVDRIRTREVSIDER